MSKSDFAYCFSTFSFPCCSFSEFEECLCSIRSHAIQIRLIDVQERWLLANWQPWHLIGYAPWLCSMWLEVALNASLRYIGKATTSRQINSIQYPLILLNFLMWYSSCKDQCLLQWCVTWIYTNLPLPSLLSVWSCLFQASNPVMQSNPFTSNFLDCSSLLLNM